jgi:hypothetical protein
MIFDLIVGSGQTTSDPSALFAAGEQGVWYDFSDLSTMFQDRAGATPVTADGQTVGKILDKSGRGHHAVAPTDAARPLYRTSGGLHWLEFNGTNNTMVSTAINFAPSDKISVFGGVRKESDVAGRIFVELGSNSPGINGSFATIVPWLESNMSTFHAFAFNARGTTDVMVISEPYTAPYTAVLTGIADIAEATVTSRVNAQPTTKISSLGTGTFLEYPLYVGSRYANSLFFHGRMYSTIVLGRLATTQEITDTEYWVASKTGVTLP